MSLLAEKMAALPLIAILRGVTPDEVLDVVGALRAAGFGIVEVPLNSPAPFESIARAVKAYPDLLVGAGTVLTPDDVETLAAAGGKLAVAPNFNPAMIAAAKARGIAAAPGVATPSEAFAALAAGADALKLFPAEALPPKVVKAWRAVLPKEVALVPVGGVTPETMAGYVAAGANGFGIGSDLYKPGRGAAEVGARAKDYAEAWARLK